MPTWETSDGVPFRDALKNMAGLSAGKMSTRVLSQELQCAVCEALLGTTNGDKADCDTGDIMVYLGYIHGQLTRKHETAFSHLFHADFRNDATFSERVLWTLTEVASLLQSNVSTLINDVVRELADKSILNETCRDDDAPLAQRLVFCVLGWITLLYIPLLPSEEPGESELLKVDTQGSPAFREREQPISQSSRPFLEVLGAFGVFSDLETPSFDPRRSVEHGGPQLFPGFLSASTLVAVGGLEICWVDTISSHLTFCPPKLFLFRLPSFARLQLHKESLLERIVGQIQDDDETLHHLAFVQLADEILSSYYLLFGADRKARSLYRSKERKNAKSNGMSSPDKLLDELCGYHASRFRIPHFEAPLTTMDVSIHFPALAPRLLRLQRFVETRQARGLRFMYHDQRNSYQWWTFWAVVCIGSATFLLSLISTGLTAVQTIYSVMSFYKDQ